MVKHLTKHGNSLALVIDRAILDLLEVDEKTPLRVQVAGRSLLVSAAETKEHTKRVRNAAEAVLRRHENVYRRLAKS